MLYVLIIAPLLITIFVCGGFYFYNAARFAAYSEFISLVTLYNLKMREPGVSANKKYAHLKNVLSWATPYVDGDKQWSEVDRSNFFSLIRNGMGSGFQIPITRHMNFIKANFSQEEAKDWEHIIANAALCRATSSFLICAGSFIVFSILYYFIRKADSKNKNIHEVSILNKMFMHMPSLALLSLLFIEKKFTF